MRFLSGFLVVVFNSEMPVKFPFSSAVPVGSVGVQGAGGGGGAQIIRSRDSPNITPDGENSQTLSAPPTFPHPTPTPRVFLSVNTVALMGILCRRWTRGPRRQQQAFVCDLSPPSCSLCPASTNSWKEPEGGPLCARGTLFSRACPERPHPKVTGTIQSGHCSGGERVLYPSVPHRPGTAPSSV